MEANIIKTPEQVRKENDSLNLFTLSKISVLEAIVNLRKELGDDTFDGSDEAINAVPNGKAEQSIKNLKELISLAETMAMIVRVDFKEILPQALDDFVSERVEEEIN